jgi:acetyl-CoA C-acetyltransferase
MNASRRVFIKGVDLHKVNNDIHCTLEGMAAQTINSALLDAQVMRKDVGAVFVGNMLSPILQKQSQLASLVCQAADLDLKDSFTLDAACGSGGSAFRAGLMAIMSGFHDTVLVVGLVSVFF